MNIVIGLALAILGGVFQGAFVLPMKYMKKWEWENGWLIFTITCCLIFPAILAFAFVPNLLQIYKDTSPAVMNAVFWFGAGWGIGVILFGLGARFLGMALGLAIVTGINACLGTLFPMFFLPEGKFSVKAGLILCVGMLVLVLGIIVISIAGAMRDKQLQGQTVKKPEVSFIVGLLVCIVGGILCPMLNFCVFFGQPISEAVIKAGGVSAVNVGYAQLLPAFVGGSFAQIIYCIYLFKKNKSFKNFFIPGTAINWLKAVSMSVIFLIGFVVYTIASVKYIKDVGPIVGWPLLTATVIITANVIGILTKEWKGVSRRAFLKMYLGILLLIGAIVLASLSNVFIPR